MLQVSLAFVINNGDFYLYRRVFLRFDAEDTLLLFSSFNIFEDFCRHFYVDLLLKTFFR